MIIRHKLTVELKGARSLTRFCGTIRAGGCLPRLRVNTSGCSITRFLSLPVERAILNAHNHNHPVQMGLCEVLS